MKKIQVMTLVIVLLTTLLLGCSSQVSNQSTESETIQQSELPRTLNERLKELQELQVESEWLAKNKDNMSKDEYLTKVKENLDKQGEVIQGKNGEPNYMDENAKLQKLYERLKWAEEQHETTGETKYQDEFDRLSAQIDKVLNERPESTTFGSK